MQTQDPKPTINVEQLAKDYGHILMRFVLRKVRNEDDAHDIVQSTYLEAIKSSHNFLGESKPQTWLIGIALNLTKNFIHKKIKRAENSLDDDDNYLQLPSNQLTPEQEAQKQQTLQEILTVFEKMPKNMRLTAYMVLCEDVSYQDAADEMEVPIGTVRSRISRAREFLKKIQTT
jgi:RNA polymerase sigma factor (sigma-70 family)